MTRNQIAYVQHQEARRHNLVTESQTAQVITETNRHNLASEGIQNRQIDEQARHNRATESISWANLAELNRSNLANEAIRSEANKIQSSSIAEIKRHNIESEGVAWYQADISKSLADSTILRNSIQNTLTQEQSSKTKAETFKTWADFGKVIYGVGSDILSGLSAGWGTK